MQWLDGWQLHSGVTKPCLADNYARNVGIFIALRLINPCTSMPAKSDIIAPKIRLLSFCHSTASVDQENKQKMQAQIRHVFFGDFILRREIKERNSNATNFSTYNTNCLAAWQNQQTFHPGCVTKIQLKMLMYLKRMVGEGGGKGSYKIGDPKVWGLDSHCIGRTIKI